jgi:hypothetical protein
MKFIDYVNSLSEKEWNNIKKSKYTIVQNYAFHEGITFEQAYIYAIGEIAFYL